MTLSFAEQSATTQTAAAQIERVLALEILQGQVAPGSRLPSVRALAKRHGVTVPTIQRAVAGLESRRLVVARQGSGVRVLDPEVHGGLALVPLWFEAYPAERAVVVLADFLQMRRLLAGHLTVAGREELLAQGERLAHLVQAIGTASDLAQTVELDLAFTQAVAAASGSFAARAVLASMGELVREVPWVAEALYGEGAGHTLAVATTAQAVLELEGASLQEAVVRALEVWDGVAVERYAALLALRDGGRRQDALELPTGAGHPGGVGGGS